MLSVSLPLDKLPLKLGQRLRHTASGQLRLGLALASRTGRVCGGCSLPGISISPMSGSPNIPPRPSREANQRGEPPALYATAVASNVYRERPALSLHQSLPPQQLPPLTTYPQEPLRAPRAFQPSPEDTIPSTPLYVPQHSLRRASQSSYARPHTASLGHAPEGAYSMASRAAAPEGQCFSPSKSVRKTKGHVASACVPCKRAHLRCDARRPCSRCLTNGKEDACVDVQHKKRGRPRLREDGEARFDPLRPPNYPDLSLRRTLSAFPPGGPGDVSQRYQAFRRAEGPLSAPPPRQFDRVAERSVYGPSSVPSGFPEPLAYLTMEMEIAKASPTFLDVLGAVSLSGRRLSEVVASSDIDKVSRMRGRLFSEQKLKEPNYLPPILGLERSVFQGMGFTKTDIARVSLNLQEQLTFITSDGRPRHYAIHVGLGKEASFFFVVLLLGPQPQGPPPSLPTAPIGVSSVAPYHAPGPQQAPALQGMPMKPFDPVRSWPQPGTLDPRSPMSLQGQLAHPSPGARPAMVSPGATYALSTGMARFSGPGEQSPQRVSSFAGRPGQQRLQLPPIRAQSDHQPVVRVAQAWRREKWPGRVGIEELIDRPE